MFCFCFVLLIFRRIFVVAERRRAGSWTWTPRSDSGSSPSIPTLASTIPHSCKTRTHRSSRRSAVSTHTHCLVNTQTHIYTHTQGGWWSSRSLVWWSRKWGSKGGWAGLKRENHFKFIVNGGGGVNVGGSRGMEEKKGSKLGERNAGKTCQPEGE